MQSYYLAVDIGASGGRHILGHLFAEIVNGMKKCKECGKTADTGAFGESKDFPDAAGLFPVSVDGREGFGVHERDFHPACKSG